MSLSFRHAPARSRIVVFIVSFGESKQGQAQAIAWSAHARNTCKWTRFEPIAVESCRVVDVKGLFIKNRSDRGLNEQEEIKSNVSRHPERVPFCLSNQI